MSVDAARSSSVVSSDSETSSSSGESLDKFHGNILQGGEVLGYQFEPGRDSNNGSGESADIEDDQNMSSDEEESVVRLGNIIVGKTSYFIVYIDKLYFCVRKLCHSQWNKLLLLGVYVNIAREWIGKRNASVVMKSNRSLKKSRSYGIH